MRMFVICNSSNLLNEGMNNIENHFSSSFSKNNEVLKCTLKKSLLHIGKIKKSDAVLVYARATNKVYHLIKYLHFFNKNIFLFVVQPIEPTFISNFCKHPLKCFFFYLDENDVLPIIKTINGCLFKVGIDKKKFYSVEKNIQLSLKQRFGFDLKKKLVLHVGHGLINRGICDLKLVDKKRFDCLLVDSGLYNENNILEDLRQSGICVLSGYQPNIQDYYQMADVYFFTTNNSNNVISIPLSITEALACGTPAIVYSSFDKVKCLTSNKFVLPIDCASDLNDYIDKAAALKSRECLLDGFSNWEEAASAVEKRIKEVMIK